jgi:hypothetical protein
MTNREKQKAYKERMYEAGYKQKMVWVMRNPEKEECVTRPVFMRKLDGLTKGWSAGRLSSLFNTILSMVKAKKEVRKKE